MPGEAHTYQNLGIVKYEDEPGIYHYQWMYIMDHGNLDRCDPPYQPTHWMPLPEPPKDAP